MALIKRCSSCKVKKSLNDFHLQSGGKYGRRGKCKLCRSKSEGKLSRDVERKKKWYKDNKQLCIERAKIQYSNNRDAKLEYQKKYYKLHKNYIKLYNKQYVKRNNNRIYENRKSWIAKNKDKSASRIGLLKGKEGLRRKN